MRIWENFTNQEQWKSYLRELVKTNDRALLRSILCVYNNQTNEEKSKGESIEDNFMGFSKIDAYEMGQIAKKIKSGQSLTKGELAKSRNKMQKYWKQLMVISKRKMEIEKQKEQEIGRTWEEIRKELFTPEEIAASDLRVAQIGELERCSSEGKACNYGICSECPKCFLEEA